MPEQIGKYRVIERVGRGGMGMIFKAHDPLLDRLVAVKVISPEVEVTDELRVRFFREAQACAKLSHPNIVTVHDMGEDEGRLFIVMELLDGEELRQIIALGASVTLEDKVSIMVQVCSGLHYAHQKGVIHRDIKPGNIMVLRDGQVKILDFGIAQIQSNTVGLTRTGLIMGTLKYIAPEQMRGVASHRSDIFSVGSVSYELLSSRPAFTGTDPMQILEHLQKQEPPRLDLLDPAIPPQLGDIVERAMRKDPAQRFSDLGAMRAELMQVQRGFADEADRIRVRARDHREQLRDLQEALVERIGPGRAESQIPPVEGGSLHVLRAVERDLAARVETLRAEIARADALAPAFERGGKLLANARYEAAAAQFEAVITDMPEHARARDELAKALAGLDRRGEREAADTVVYTPPQRATAPPASDARATRAWTLRWPIGVGALVGLVALGLGGVWWMGLDRRERATPVAREVTTRPQATPPAEPTVAATPAGKAPARESPPSQTPAVDATRPPAEPETRRAAPTIEARPGRSPTPVAERPASPRREAGASPTRVAVVSRTPEADQARTRMLTARQQAERAAAGFFVPKLFAAAQTKEQEADAALGRADVAAAVRLLGEAQSEYQAAAVEAKRETEKEWQLAPLKAAVEQARARTVAGRAEAISAEADRLAGDLFTAAQAKHAEADDLAKRQSFAASARAYDEASERYRVAAATGRSAAPGRAR